MWGKARDKVILWNWTPVTQTLQHEQGKWAHTLTHALIGTRLHSGTKKVKQLYTPTKPICSEALYTNWLDIDINNHQSASSHTHTPTRHTDYHSVIWSIHIIVCWYYYIISIHITVFTVSFYSIYIILHDAFLCSSGLKLSNNTYNFIYFSVLVTCHYLDIM